MTFRTIYSDSCTRDFDQTLDYVYEKLKATYHVNPIRNCTKEQVKQLSKEIFQAMEPHVLKVCKTLRSMLARKATELGWAFDRRNVRTQMLRVCSPWGSLVLTLFQPDYFATNTIST